MNIASDSTSSPRKRRLRRSNVGSAGGNSRSRVLYGRLVESLDFRALESGDIRLLEFTNPSIAPIVGGRIGIDFTISTSSLA